MQSNSWSRGNLVDILEDMLCKREERQTGIIFTLGRGMIALRNLLWAWWPELHPWDTHKDGRRELTSKRCPLTSTYTPWHVPRYHTQHVHTWAHMYTSVLGFLLLWWKTMSKIKLGRRGIICLTLPHCCPSLKDARMLSLSRISSILDKVEVVLHKKQEHIITNIHLYFLEFLVTMA